MSKNIPAEPAELCNSRQYFFRTTHNLDFMWYRKIYEKVYLVDLCFF